MLCGSFNASTTNNFPAAQHVSTQASAMNPVLYDCGGGKSLATQAVAKEDAWFAKLDAARSHRADLELHADKIVQSHASSNKVAASER